MPRAACGAVKSGMSGLWVEQVEDVRGEDGDVTWGRHRAHGILLLLAWGVPRCERPN